MKIRQYLSEAVTLSADFYEMADDFPPSGIVGGENMVPQQIDSVNGKMRRFISDEDFTWDEFKGTSGMETPLNYHPSRKGLTGVIKRDSF